MRLVACENCHTQFDVSSTTQDSFKCRCGETVENHPLRAVDAEVCRCGSCGAIVRADADLCEYCGSAIVRDTRTLSLICPECYARNEEKSRFCTACGVRFDPEPVPAHVEELPCVKCGGLMPVRRVGGVSVNECTQCHGLWVPGERFDELVNRAIETQKNAGIARLPGPGPRVQGGNPVAERIEYRKCPICGAFMQRRNFRKKSGVVVDRCHEHGTWLDADELEQIAGFILSGGLERVREDEQRAASWPAPVGSPPSPPPSRASADFQRILMENKKPVRDVGSTLLEAFGKLLGEMFR